MAVYTFQDLGGGTGTNGSVLMTRVSDNASIIIDKDFFNLFQMENWDGSNNNSINLDALFQTGLDKTFTAINEFVTTEEYTYQNIGNDDGSGNVLVTRTSDGVQKIITNSLFSTSGADIFDGANDNSVNFDVIWNSATDVVGGSSYTFQPIGSDNGSGSLLLTRISDGRQVLVDNDFVSNLINIADGANDGIVNFDDIFQIGLNNTSNNINEVNNASEYTFQDLGEDGAGGTVLMTRVFDGKQVLLSNSVLTTSIADAFDGSDDNAIDLDAIFQIGLDNTNNSVIEVAGSDNYIFQNLGSEVFDINFPGGAVLVTRDSDGAQVLISNSIINTNTADNTDGTNDNVFDLDEIFQIGLSNANDDIIEVVGGANYSFQSFGDEDESGLVVMTRLADDAQVIISKSVFNPTTADVFDGTTDNILDLDAIFQIGLNNTSEVDNEIGSGFILCFTRGTTIKTVRGEVPIENLKVDDEVMTLDCGYQPIRWIGDRRLSRAELEANPKLLPVRIRAGALGPGVPERDLLVSPQHRVLIRNAVAKRMYDCAEVLIPANKLLTLPGIDIERDAVGVEYFHMLFEAHQIVWSNGALTESLFTGPEALKAVSAEAREEIRTLFPEIVAPDYVPVPARPIPEKGKLMKRLAQRLAKNNKYVQDLMVGR